MTSPAQLNSMRGFVQTRVDFLCSNLQTFHDTVKKLLVAPFNIEKHCQHNFVILWLWYKASTIFGEFGGKLRPKGIEPKNFFAPMDTSAMDPFSWPSCLSDIWG